MSTSSSVDHSEIESALGSIGLSATIILGATLLSQGLGLLTRITMARYLPVDGYGNVVIGLSILNLFGLVALAGMPAALSRYLPRKEQQDERQSILASGFQIVGVLSILVSLATFLAAEPMAIYLFKNESLVWVIRVFAGILPFYAILNLSIGGFRGYEQTYPRVLTQNVLRPGLQLAGIVLFVSVGFGTTGIAFAYGAAFIVVAIVAVSLLYKNSEFSLGGLASLKSPDQYWELLTFSVPLAASGAISVIAKHSDLIILGIYKSSADVGIYEVAFRIAIFVSLLFAPAVGYLFQPIMSRFDADADYQKMNKLYTVATRWIVVASFPVFALFFLFPEQSLGFFFGEGYQSGRVALRILLIGFMISLLPGLTGMFLAAVGETKLHMYISAATMVLNVVINVVLIPVFGIVGAAIATAIARIFNNLVQSYFIYRNHEIHPFDRDYVFPTVLMGFVFISIYLAPISYVDLTFLEGTLVAGGVGLVYLLLLFATRSIFAVELKLVDGVLERLGVRVSIAERLEPFVR